MRGTPPAWARLAAGVALAIGAAASGAAFARTPAPLFHGVDSVAVLCRIEGTAADTVPDIAELCARAAAILRGATTVPVTAISFADVPQLTRGALIVGVTAVAEPSGKPPSTTILTLAVDLRRLPPVQPGLFDPPPASLVLPADGGAAGLVDHALERLLSASVGEPLAQSRPR